MVGPHLFVPPGPLGRIDGTNNQRVEPMAGKGVGVGKRGHEERLYRQREKVSALFKDWRALSRDGADDFDVVVSFAILIREDQFADGTPFPNGVPAGE